MGSLLALVLVGSFLAPYAAEDDRHQALQPALLGGSRPGRLARVSGRQRRSARKLSEPFVCLDLIDERMAGEQPEQHLLLPRAGLLRREGLRIGALCSGICEKAFSLVYDREVRQQSSAFWTQRCRTQVRETLVSLEASCAKRLGDFLLDHAISHADIAATCALAS